MKDNFVTMRIENTFDLKFVNYFLSRATEILFAKADYYRYYFLREFSFTYRQLTRLPIFGVQVH